MPVTKGSVQGFAMRQSVTNPIEAGESGGVERAGQVGGSSGRITGGCESESVNEIGGNGATKSVLYIPPEASRGERHIETPSNGSAE